MRLLLLAVCCAPALSACVGEDAPVYCCEYESRVSGCGNANFGEWELRRFTLDLEQFEEGTSAASLCEDRYTGSEQDTEVCEITIEYRLAERLPGEC